MKKKMRYSVFKIDSNHPQYPTFQAAILDGNIAIAYCFTMKFAKELAYSLNLKEHAEKTNWQSETLNKILEKYEKS